MSDEVETSMESDGSVDQSMLGKLQDLANDLPDDGNEACFIGGGDMPATSNYQAGVFKLSTFITSSELNLLENVELLNLSLHQCARDGKPEVMQRLLTSLQGNVKKKINAHDEDELSALHYAARYNHYHIVKMLIEHGANVADTDDEGATALHFAARYKPMRLNPAGEEEAVPPMPEPTVDNSVIMYLVSAGAMINAEDKYGCTPLHFAAMRGNEVATKELLLHKPPLYNSEINIEAVDKQKMTALHMAASHNEEEICRMLIKANANLCCSDEESATPLHYACMEGSLKIVEMLFEAGEAQDGWVTVSKMLNDKDNQDNTPLHYAVENRNYDVAKLCIEKGANVNVTRTNYSTPLHLAAVAGDVQICQLLVDHTARIDALDITQSTPLHKAAAFNHVDVIEFLLDRGANIDKCDKDSFSPLILAASEGHAEAVEVLLARGADPYHLDKNDKTCIFWAAEEDNLEVLKLLLNHPRAQAIIDATDRYDWSPLHIAAQKGYLSCVKVLLDAGVDMDGKNEDEQTPLHLAAKYGRMQVVRELVKRNKMVINDEDEDSNTALHLAALAGHNKVVTALLDAGADIEARNCTLWTPLDCAAAKGWQKTVKVLLDADAPVDPMDKAKTTPLHLAASRGHVQVVNLLIASHADVGAKDTDNLNCLDMAIENGHKDVAMAIINSPKWKEALRNQTKSETSSLRNTPMRKLIRKMPDVAEHVFNRCTTSFNHPEHHNFKITFDYEFLDDMFADKGAECSETASLSVDSIYDEYGKLLPTAQPYTSDSTKMKKNHPLQIMVDCNQEDLLAHPLVTSLLRHKWNSYGRYVYYPNLFLYCMFVTFLTGYVITTPAPYSFINETNPAADVSSSCDLVQANFGPITQHQFAYIGKYVIMALAAFNIIREILEMVNAGLAYFGWENLMEWIIYITALLLVIDFDQCQRDTGLRQNWQWQLAAACIFLTWVNLVLFIRKFPLFGIYVVMFTDIFYTFMQFLPVFFLLVVAFALAFFVLLSNQYAFRNVGQSLLKTSVMMIGELEYTDIFLGMDGVTAGTTEAHKNMLYYNAITYIIFVTFLILLTIIIMNLLVGLAVDDIKAVQEKAVLTRLAMQVELALNVESILPRFIQRKFVVKTETIYPNQNRGLKKCLNLDSTFMTASSILKALNPELDDRERMEENQDKMMKNISNLRTRVKNMEQQNIRIENMLKAIIISEGIQYEENDAILDDPIN